ncbi:related to SNF2 family DNA-dependent ATPase [Lecanosticta acicola]|uniref:DNA helicase n=1 Tax=Lecanosticta acicola TaxID=111012 RepID=A0AAI9EEE8_9PEZI|nr:related to SNF2 family DNA-dependent ATPase [Lecanosticta acicola]
MADRHDPIVDETPNKRRKLNSDPSSGQAWDSQDDEAGDFNEDDFQTEATLPLPGTQKRQLAYTAEQFQSDYAASARASSSQPAHVTQPTQTLKHVTQPTQPVPPKSHVQVERSSPMAPDNSSQRPMPQPINRAPFAKPGKAGGVLASAMAPPGTSFRRPQGIQSRPQAIDIDSDDDPPIERSDDEGTQGLGSNIKPTNFKKAGRGLDSSPNRVVQETPRSLAKQSNNTFENILSNFGYKPSHPPARPADDMASSYAGTSRTARPTQPTSRQNGPGPAIFAPLRGHVFKSLEDIPLPVVRRKVSDMRTIMGHHHDVQSCMDALERKRYHMHDAMAYLASKEEESDELASGSPIRRKGVAQSVSQTSQPSSQPIRSTAKQQVKAPAKTIAEKYNRGVAKTAQRQDGSDSDEDEDVKPNKRGRILQGRKSGPASPPSSPPAVPQPRSRKQVITIDSDDDEDSGVGRDASEEYAKPAKEAEPETFHADLQGMRDTRLLKLINEATAHDLSELSGQQEDKIQFVLDKRPFASLDDVCAVVQAGLTKTGKPSKKSSPLGEKLVEDCREVMTGYDAIDELVVQCEKIAQPLQEALRGWGVGESTGGELQLMSLDEAHDSGIGTPSSSVPPEDAPSQKSSKNKPKGSFIGQPSNMNQDLAMKNYQLVGLNWLYLLFTKELSCILADDMGLGKTCQIIGFLSYLQLKEVDGVHLIIVPGSTLENWLREFERFAPSMSVQPYYGHQSERTELQYNIEKNWGNIDVIVTTYDMAVSKHDNAFLRKMGPFSVCVYDEAHALRNPNSLRYRQLVRLEADFKVLLTGTPLQNNLQELVAILAFIMPNIFSEKEDDLQYIFKHKASTKDTASAALLSNDRIARARTMMTPFILRRKKAQVLDLPTKTTRVEYCDMTDSQANYYADLWEDAQKFYTEKAAGGTKGTARQSSNVIMALRKAAIHPLLARRLYDDKVLDKMVKALRKTDEFGDNPPDKIRAYLDGTAAQSLKGGDFGLHKFSNERETMRKRFALKHDEWMDSGKVKRFQQLVSEYAKNGDRVLVFSQFTTLMDILEAVLETMNIRFMRLDGSTKMDTRQDMIDQFYEDNSITVFMLSTRAGGAGINLAAANKVIIFDSGFNPQDDIQAENRAHRVGQTRPVEVVRLVTKGTIEEQIHALGESKLALDERVAGEGATDAESKQADKLGEQMVEKMFVEKIKDEETDVQQHSIPMTGDLKDAFKHGLEGEGLKVESKQAQF